MTISTEPATVIQSQPRRPRWLEIALILSLALNCFIVGGVAMAAWHFRYPQMPPLDIEVEAISGAMGLSTAETSDLLAFSRSARLNAAITRSENEPLINLYLGELIQPNPRSDFIANIEKQIRKNKDDMRQKINNDFVSWLQQLNIEKRKLIVSRIRDPRDPMTRGFRRIIGISSETRNPP